MEEIHIYIWNLFNSLAPGRCDGNFMCFKSIIFILILQTSSFGIKKLLSGEYHRTSLRKSQHGSGGGNKPLPEPMLNQICVATQRH